MEPREDQHHNALLDEERCLHTLPKETDQHHGFDRAMFVATSRAADLNELGVLHMQRRKYRQATATFADALSLLNVEVLSSPVFQEMERQEVEDPANEPQQQQLVAAENEDAVVFAHQLPQDQPEHDISTSKEQCGTTSSSVASVPVVDTPTAPAAVPITCDEEQVALDMQEDLLYRTPISFSDDFMRDTSSSFHGVVEMSISLMFNFALSHQLTAVSGQSPDPVVTLGHSISLYELAHTLQLHEGIDLGMEHTMATINNLGHIHRVLGDEEKAAKCFQHLLSIIMYLQVQEHIDGSRNLEADESMSSTRRSLVETDVFFKSVSPLILSDAAAAPAA